MFINKRIKDLSYFAKINSSQYKLAKPFSHIIFNNFFNDDFLSSVLDEFPIFEDSKNKQKIYNLNENKIISKGEKSFKKNTKLFFHYLNSEPFLNFLQILTSIQETLIPDPYFSGGGFHESKKNGFLNIHADFNKHYLTNLDRRLNMLIYLNKKWSEDYGGNLELWDKNMEYCGVKVVPIFNRIVIFSTTSKSYHGNPVPVNCPDNLSRKSIALYYYTNGRPISEMSAIHDTLYKKRRGIDKLNFIDKQTIKYFLKDFTPPYLMRIIKKIIKR